MKSSRFITVAELNDIQEAVKVISSLRGLKNIVANPLANGHSITVWDTSDEVLGYISYTEAGYVFNLDER